MPNWCNNQVTVSFRNKKQADEFAKACIDVRPEVVPGTLFEMTEPMNLFQHYVPEPEATPDWYSWRISNWGTKWAPDIAEILRLGDTMVQITFDAAWGPPIEFFTQGGAAHDWKWEMIYIETGMAFAGSAAGDKDGVSHSDSFTDSDPEYLEIADQFGISFEDYDDDSKPTP